MMKNKKFFVCYSEEDLWCGHVHRSASSASRCCIRHSDRFCEERTVVPLHVAGFHEAQELATYELGIHDYVELRSAAFKQRVADQVRESERRKRKKTTKTTIKKQRVIELIESIQSGYENGQFKNGALFALSCLLQDSEN